MVNLSFGLDSGFGSSFLILMFLSARGALIRREAERLAGANFKADVDLAVLDIHIDDLLIVNPRFNAVGLHCEPDVKFYLPLVNSRMRVVSLAASLSSMLEMPHSAPPQPPMISDAQDLLTGNVRPQKKSLPSTRWASSSIS